VSYLHIDNLYKNQDILLFRDCYATEKVHGTSAHLTFKREKGLEPAGDRLHLSLFAGGIKSEDFAKLFDAPALLAKFHAQDLDEMTVYGEAYGGKCQGMSKTYGKALAFIVFEVSIKGTWLNVMGAENVAKALGLEFVPYRFVHTDLASIDEQRDAPSIVAERRGCGNDKMREGIVLRPPIEVIKSNGGRIIAKHKRPEFCETMTPREVNPDKLKVLHETEAIVNEWVTEMRLTHVLQAFTPDLIDVNLTGDIIKAMLADIEREAAGEVELSRDARKGIGAKTAQMFQRRLRQGLRRD